VAQVDVEKLLGQYEAEIGRLNGQIIRNKAAYEAEKQELVNTIVTTRDEIEAIKRDVQEAAVDHEG
jgi:hypothetical protein